MMLLDVGNLTQQRALVNFAPKNQVYRQNGCCHPVVRLIVERMSYAAPRLQLAKALSSRLAVQQRNATAEWLDCLVSEMKNPKWYCLGSSDPVLTRLYEMQRHPLLHRDYYHV